ncbi:hypothetical protein STANM309S_00551 [Streptomyces tanashiensis]
MVAARRGTTCSQAKRSTACTSEPYAAATAGIASTDQSAASIASTSSRALASASSAVVRVAADSSRPRASRRPGRACVPPQIWRARRMERTRLTRASPSGAPPRTCRPSRIWASLTSHSQPSTCSRKSSKPSSSGRSSRPRSWSSLAAWIRVQIWARIAGSFAGSMEEICAYSSSSCSRRAMSPYESARAIGGTRWSTRVAWTRRLAWVPSPGSLTRNG